jgi:hypothetical protein
MKLRAMWPEAQFWQNGEGGREREDPPEDARYALAEAFDDDEISFFTGHRHSVHLGLDLSKQPQASRNKHKT